jgi:hypothetical protein
MLFALDCTLQRRIVKSYNSPYKCVLHVFRLNFLIALGLIDSRAIS